MQFLTGNEEVKMSDTIFNFDLTSPTTNAIARQMSSVSQSSTPSSASKSRSFQEDDTRHNLNIPIPTKLDMMSEYFHADEKIPRSTKVAYAKSSVRSGVSKLFKRQDKKCSELKLQTKSVPPQDVGRDPNGRNGARYSVRLSSPLESIFATSEAKGSPPSSFPPPSRVLKRSSSGDKLVPASHASTSPTPTHRGGVATSVVSRIRSLSRSGLPKVPSYKSIKPEESEISGVSTVRDKLRPRK